MSTTPPNYPWQRYLCPANESYLRTDDGFLVVPDALSLWRTNQHLQKIQALEAEPCLVILGEPGIGKSSVMRESANGLRERLGQADQVVWESFSSFATASDLRSELFDRPKFVTWQAGKGALYLFLDGLDEAHERIDLLMQALLRNLRDQPCARLFLRLACRTTIWPSDLEPALRELWQLKVVPVYKVTVLTREDIRLTAQSSNINPDLFFNQLTGSDVTPLAAIPLTLCLLLQQYDPSQPVLPSRTVLYDKGCHGLCEEQSESHRRSKTKPQTSSLQRLIVAARIAALSLLAGCESINCSPNWPSTKNTDLTLSDVVGFAETVKGQALTVNEQVVSETLDTGLFTPHTGGRYAWAHRTFQEYLTAYYLVRHHRSVADTLTLFTTPEDPNGKFPPQFQEVIGWLAALNPEIKQAVLMRDPVLLLTSDSATVTAEERAKLVAWLLTSVEQGQHFPGFGEYRFYQKLNHPTLAEQLQAVLMNSTAALPTRRLAIDLAEHNHLQSLQDTLVRLALDSSSSLPLRIDAAQAVARIGNTNAKQQLKALLHTEIDNTYYQLKGAALRALWPDHLSAQELFSALTLRNDGVIIDDYRLFIESEIVEKLKIADLPEALAWVERNTTVLQESTELESLIDGIIWQALLYLHIDKVRKALLPTLLTRLEYHKWISAQPRSVDQQQSKQLDEVKRHQLFRLLLEECVETEKDIWLLIYAPLPLVTPADLPWLVETLYPQLFTPAQQHALATVIGYLWYHNDPAQTALIFAAIQQHPILAEHFLPIFQPIPLHSEQAKELRERYQRIEAQKRIQDESTHARYVPQVETWLAATEADSLLWWRLNLELTATTTGFRNEHEPNIMKMPGWLAATAEMQQRIVMTAIVYLSKGDPANAEWFGKSDILYRPAQAGYRAFYLLQQANPDYLDRLFVSELGKWCLAIITAGEWALQIDQAIDRKVLSLLAQNCKHDFVAAGTEVLNVAPTATDLAIVINRLNDVWQTAFSTALWQQLNQHSADLDYLRHLFPPLLKFDPIPARAYAVQVLAHLSTQDNDSSEAALIVGVSLLSDAEDFGWPTLWPVIQTHIEFGKKLFLHAAHDLRHSQSFFPKRLAISEMAALFEWLVTYFPYEDDPPNPHMSAPLTSHHFVCRLRDSLLRTLVNTGSRESVTALESLFSQQPTIPDREHQLFAAKEHLRRSSWQPLTPQTLLDIVFAKTRSKSDAELALPSVVVHFNNAINIGSGAIAQGGATAAGAHGVAIHGDTNNNPVINADHNNA